jgi:hypothetical protein
MRMDIEKVINRKVLIVLFSHEGLEKAGITDRNFYAKLVGYDQIGLWIENPKFEVVNVRREDGSLIPVSERQKETHIAEVLIPWGNVKSIVYFPYRKGFNLEEDGITNLDQGTYL